MTPLDFPILTTLGLVYTPKVDPLAPLPTTSPSSRRFSESWVPRIALMLEAAAAGVIPNARFKESAEMVNRALENAWRSLTHYDELDGSPASEAVMNIIYKPSPSWLNVDRYQKLVKALPESHQKTRWTALLDEAAPLAALCKDLKGKAVKRQLKTEEERLADRYAPPVSTSAAVARVHEVLNEAVDGAYSQLLEFFVKRNRDWLDSYQQGRSAAQKDPTLCQPSRYEKSGFAPLYTPSWHFSNREPGPHFQTHTTPATLIQSVFHQNRLLTNAVDLLDLNAQAVADDIRQRFVAKNLRKLVSILENKGDACFGSATVVEHTVSLSGLRGVIDFAFKDGSSFRVNNAVVFVTNSFYTTFYRYPLTFHEVVLPGGERLSQPSEERMNTVFAPVSVKGETNDGNPGQVELPPSSSGRSRPKI